MSTKIENQTNNALGVANFEDALAKLETLVTEIEDNEIALESALTKYELGVKLIQFCQEKLKQVEQKIKILDEASSSLKDF